MITTKPLGRATILCVGPSTEILFIDHKVFGVHYAGATFTKAGDLPRHIQKRLNLWKPRNVQTVPMDRDDVAAAAIRGSLDEAYKPENANV